MILLAEGSIFDAKVDALVNPVNCYGTSGAGLAKAFAGLYPEPQREYKKWCRLGHARLGSVLGAGSKPTIYYFPTKGHWRDGSRLEDIVTGLEALRLEIVRNGHGSVAVPALGCGLGGLRWEPVYKAICEGLGDLNADIHVYRPR